MTNLGQDEDRKGLTKGRIDRKYNFTETALVILWNRTMENSWYVYSYNPRTSTFLYSLSVLLTEGPWIF